MSAVVLERRSGTRVVVGFNNSSPLIVIAGRLISHGAALEKLFASDGIASDKKPEHREVKYQ